MAENTGGKNWLQRLATFPNFILGVALVALGAAAATGWGPF